MQKSILCKICISPYFAYFNTCTSPFWHISNKYALPTLFMSESVGSACTCPGLSHESKAAGSTVRPAQHHEWSRRQPQRNCFVS